MNNELIRALHDEIYDVTDDGVYFPKQGVLASGEYRHTVNGGDLRIDKNLLTAEGLTHLLAVAMGATAKPTGYYMALYAGAVSPAANWTAASFAATASEIVSLSEGFSEVTRPLWTPAAAAAGVIDNFVAAARFTITTASSINVNGAALLSSNVRGGTSGVLVSASKYAATRTMYNGETYDLGYRVTLTA
ncbi:hypothetical protein [Propionivibrio sp.]|uniref:hypothetical protein n=1 Tax=Propionivibrio sp. TaxID=2212460 RepID=UPI003BF2430A